MWAFKLVDNGYWDVTTVVSQSTDMLPVLTGALSHLDMCFITSPCRVSWLSSYSFIGLQLAGFLFTALLFSPWYVHHVRSHSLGTDSMVKIVQEEEHFCAFRALRQPTELCQLETEESEKKVPRGWRSWGSELWCWLSCARWAPSQLDRVVKMSVKDVILYLTLCRPAQLL